MFNINCHVIAMLGRASRAFKYFAPHRYAVLCRFASCLWSKEVGPRGNLKVDWRCGQTVDVRVRSVDVSKTVAGNRAEVLLEGEQLDASDLSVDSTYGDLLISGTSRPDSTGNGLVLSVEVPPQFNVHVSGDHSVTGVSINNMECDLVDINLEHGHTLLDHLKASTCSVSTTTGNIETNSYIQGTLDLKTGSGSIRLLRAQGSTLLAKTQSGLISIESLYFGKSTVKTISGLLSLGALHGTADVISKTGDIRIQTVDGSVCALTKKGDIDMHVERCGSIRAESFEGNVNLKLGNNVRLTDSQLVVSAGQGVDIEDDLCDSSADTDCHITVGSKEGSVRIQRQSWLDSFMLNIKK